MHSATELTKLIEEIEKIKLKLDNLILSKGGNLLDYDVIELSQQLDNLITQYYGLK